MTQLKEEVSKTAPSSSEGKKMRKAKRKRSYDIANDALLF